MKLLEDYFKLQKEVHDYFGYKEDWVCIPLQDHTDMYWKLDEDEFGHGDIIYFDEPLTPDIVEDMSFYQDEIYTQRFLSKWVYRGEEYTMVCSSPGVDGNKFLSVYDNAKEQKEISE